jgi:hypothetical protein
VRPVVTLPRIGVLRGHFSPLESQTQASSLGEVHQLRSVCVCMVKCRWAEAQVGVAWRDMEVEAAVNHELGLGYNAGSREAAQRVPKTTK